MKLQDRAQRWIAQVSLLVILLAVSAFLLLYPYLDDDERIYNEGAVTEVVERGPVTIADVTWKVESMRPYTRLVDVDKKPIEVDGMTAGSVVVLVKVELTPQPGLRLNDGGFTCSSKLRDDRGNVWSSVNVYGDFPLPSYCSDDDRPIRKGQPTEVAQIFVVPASAVPHLTGIEVESREGFRRVLLTF